MSNERTYAVCVKNEGYEESLFLDDFPPVSHDQAVAASEEAREFLVSNAPSG